ncbi:hypothetical protein J22TS1_17460 [Siminovitchia terrae]|nr:hypothetical protein J22TS1_17460 [Siminovitchia terrae]
MCINQESSVDRMKVALIFVIIDPVKIFKGLKNMHGCIKYLEFIRRLFFIYNEENEYEKY